MTPEDLAATFVDRVQIARDANCGAAWHVSTEDPHCDPRIVAGLDSVTIIVESPPLRVDEVDGENDGDRQLRFPTDDAIARHIAASDPLTMLSIFDAFRELYERAELLAAENTMLRAAARPYEALELPMEQAS